MDNFGFNGMSDEEFRKEFMKFLNLYQSGLESFMKKTYKPRGLGFMSNPFFNIQPMDDDMLREIFKNLDNVNSEFGDDVDGEWEKKSWMSPYGSSSFSSYTKSFYDQPESKYSPKKNQNELDTIKLLETKLNKAVFDEKYEDAAKIRDLIKSLKEDKKED
jgi:excinuclease UvrABC helicase subunit UvrB